MDRPETDLPVMKNCSFARRLSFALAGIRAVARLEKSFRTQLALAAAALLALLMLRPGPLWSALVLLSCSFVLALEASNAALEYALGRLHPTWSEEIGRAKDAAAGAVLIASFGAAAVGGLMLAAAIT